MITPIDSLPVMYLTMGQFFLFLGLKALAYLMLFTILFLVLRKPIMENLKEVWRKAMYIPKIKDEYIASLYAMATKQKRSSTELVNEILARAIEQADSKESGAPLGKD